MPHKLKVIKGLAKDHRLTITGEEIRLYLAKPLTNDDKEVMVVDRANWILDKIQHLILTKVATAEIRIHPNEPVRFIDSKGRHLFTISNDGRIQRPLR